MFADAAHREAQSLPSLEISEVFSLTSCLAPYIHPM